MRTLFTAVACCMLVAAVGCDKNRDKDMSTSGMKDNTMASMDVCSHCAGVQKATAEGTCPGCGMKVATGAGNAR